VRTSVYLFLFSFASVAHAQDLKRGSELIFEYPAERAVSGGSVRSYLYPANQPQMLTALAAARHLSLYPALSFAVAVEAETTIDGTSYRLFFPRVPQREAPYVFAVAPATSPMDRIYFEIPRERCIEFASLFRDILNQPLFSTLQSDP
jgi:hypothetical protein